MLSTGLLVVVLATAAPSEIVGPARAIDGDTLAVGRLTVRLHGVDAPELGQACRTATGAAWDCGAAARARLAQLLDAGGLRCEALGGDRFGRVVARCAAGGRDLGAALVSEGLAWAYRRYSRDYVAAEARAAGRGVWRGAAQTPWDWRREGGWRAASGTAATAACAIKGNVSATGERLFHTPHSPWRGRAEIDPPAGQRWLCDAAEAEAAGWRPASGSH